MDMRIPGFLSACCGALLLSSCFSPKAHDTLLQHAFKDRLQPGKIKLMEASSRKFDKDTQSTEECYKHSMASKDLPPQKALVKRDNFVEGRIQAAREHAMRGECNRALEVLAQGLHTVMDSASDEHVDSKGMPKVWDPLNPWRHSPFECWGHETVKDITPGDYWTQYKELNAAFDKAFKGTPCLSKVLK